MTGPEFRHDRPGTPAAAWTDTLARRTLAPLQLPASRSRLVVVGAHPDDETLGAGGLIRSAALAGWRVEVVTATAGEGSHPHSPSHTPQQLADVRRAELRAAITGLAPEATVTCLDLPDGDVASHATELVAALVAAIGTDGADVLLCAPWRRDGHPDHEAVGRAAAVAAARTDARLLEYPVWLWHWGTEDDLPWDRATRLPLDAADLAAKRAAVAAHASQVGPLSDAAGDEVLLDDDLLAHFERDELFIACEDRVDDDALDVVHRERPDPWQVDSFYERRKRALTLASLPREHYGRALEVGCSVGALAVDLAGRCDHLLALDASETAIDLARRRTAGVETVDVRRARVPAEWPDGRFDLVSISEVGYFLSPRELGEVVGLALRALTDDGHLLLCHWRHQPVGWPLAGPAVHDAFLATGAPVLVEHQETDFLLHVLGRPS
ncbi:bifunctional PIG-L family deacetylase/class I SAM-dependent methyltransferase [Nocardioides sp.]|uniref:bifunctional PIG-L family deacetylase/class I SAM-dependent methyltransferase n=1 Tax=Nocardioides sp. TaxID=35761 RepID=UPI0026241408|nr:bifunctional PIG-L family deacetylase/class I SAM-dependent methyltransferase [Nocardioides sp.]MCW2735544.1 methyltransferase protein [Nocardioides sp.]